MRVAIITESFPPDVNGVSHSVVRTVEHLLARGHEPLVVAPTARRRASATGTPDVPVVRIPSVGLPGYPGFRLGLPLPAVAAALTAHNPDVVQLASPFTLGAHGAFVAARLGIPSVAIYQTDVPGFAGFYRVGGGRLGRAGAWRWLRAVHGRAARTLAPSSACRDDLTAHGIPDVHLWPRGVDSVRFHPDRRSTSLRAGWQAGTDAVVIGYIGRLAPEKRVELLAPLNRLPGVRVVVVGDGPSAASLRQLMPGAVFTGELTGDALAEAFASLDVFVHTGPHETFCQTVQEAMASGVPVVAPAAGGPLDLVRPGRTGLLAAPGDAGAIAEAVATLVADKSLRLAYGAAGRAAVAGRTWTAVGDMLLDHYAAVLGTSANAVARAA
jgi:phosphatidylinositol alpha 1,6-mannosyltransferase